MIRHLAAVAVAVIILAGTAGAQALEPQMSAQELSEALTDPHPEHVLVPILMMVFLVLQRF